jgi:hypothetical protein
MKTKHTPGPWVVGYTAETATVDAECRMICELENYYGDEDANAKLIAAAPDLLEALQEIERRLVDPDNPRSQTWMCSDALHPNNDEKNNC